MLKRRTTQDPQRILQSFCQRHIAFAAENDMGMRETGVGEAEVIEPMVKPNARDRHAQIGHVGEIRQSHPAGFMDLAEDHLLVRTMQSPPRADPTLQRAARAIGQVGMAPLHLFEDGHRAQLRRRSQHWHHLGVKERDQRIGTPAPAWLRLGRGRSVILFEAIGGGRADRRLRGRDRWAVCLSECHVKPHLVIGDMAAGQWADPFTRISIQSSSRSRSTDGPRSPRESRPSLLTLAPPVGLRPPCAASVRRLSHLDRRPFSR